MRTFNLITLNVGLKGFILLSGVSFGLFSLAQNHDPAKGRMAGGPQVKNFDKKDVVPAPQNTAQATLDAKNGSQVKGVVNFNETPDGLHIEYNISGLAKNANFGFHIHEKGDCSSPDGKSAGGHYISVAPTGGTSKETPGKFAGDLPMLKSDANGQAKGAVDVKLLTVNRDFNHAVAGKSILVHGGPDDRSKPSAPRIACGEIKPKTGTN